MTTYELLLDGGKTVRWPGADPEDAARRPPAAGGAPPPPPARPPPRGPPPAATGTCTATPSWSRPARSGTACSWEPPATTGTTDDRRRQPRHCEGSGCRQEPPPHGSP